MPAGVLVTGLDQLADPDEAVALVQPDAGFVGQRDHATAVCGSVRKLTNELSMKWLTISQTLGRSSSVAGLTIIREW